MQILTQIVKEYQKSPPNTKIYLGSDSVRFKKRKDNSVWAKITVVAVLHLGSSHGCKVIGYNETERVWDSKPDRPQHRMMLEVYEVSKLYLALVEELPDAPIEVHLDINPDESHGSSCAAKQAFGYIQGVCQVKPVLKPAAWAASTCADLFNKKITC